MSLRSARRLLNRAAHRHLKARALAAAALTNTQIQLPILNPAPLAEVLEYRQTHDTALQQAREKLGWMARRIKARGWGQALNLLTCTYCWKSNGVHFK